MSITLSQANRPLQVKSSLGADELIPVALSGVEAVSQPFHFVVDFVSTNPAIAAASVLGKPMGLTIMMPEGGKRQVHGIVSRFSQLGAQRDIAGYRAEIVPALWLLSLATECRTFENQSIPEIVAKVLKDDGLTDFSVRVMGSQKPQPFVAQYRESTFAFVSRLLEAAGLYYMFEHAADKHTMVITDAKGGSVPAGAMASVRVGLLNPGAQVDIDTVTELARAFAVHTGKVEIRDHALLRVDSVGSAQSAHPGAAGTHFDFLGDLGPDDSANEARREIERKEVGHDQVSGSGTCASFTAGTRVKLVGGVAGTAGLELHLLRVDHQMTVPENFSGTEASYQNRFTAIEAATPYRPPLATAWPSVRGTQTAKVVGTGGAGEIDVDADGRVLLQFPWDSGAGKDGKSKHRVHVASVWAGASWGFVQLPRIGQEVLVEFLEGDPDRPIVTGRVYNSASKPPYALPANKTQSGWKSRTLGGGSDNFNELRFEDKKGEEHVFLQAEKDLQVKVKNDETRDVLHDRTTTIKNADTRTVKEGDDTHTVEKGNHKLVVSKGNHGVIVEAGNQVIEVEKDQSTTIFSGNRTTKIEQGNDEVKIATGDLTITVDKGNVTIKAGAGKITLDAMQGIELKCGQSKMELKPAEVSLKSVQVKMAGDAKMELGAPMVKVEGQAQTEIKGAMLKVEGQAMTTIKGAIAQVTGDGMLKAGGGITMLG